MTILSPTLRQDVGLVVEDNRAKVASKNEVLGGGQGAPDVRDPGTPEEAVVDAEGFAATLGDHGMDEQGDVGDRATADRVVLPGTTGAVTAYGPRCR